jgi:hypothetical protein
MCCSTETPLLQKENTSVWCISTQQIGLKKEKLDCKKVAGIRREIAQIGIR